MVKRLVRGMTVAGAAVLAVGLLPTGANAGGGYGNEDWAGSGSAPSTGSTGGVVAQPVQETGCTVVSTPHYLGAACGDSNAGEGRTVKQILGDDPVPTCWHEDFSAQDHEGTGFVNTGEPDPKTWYWEWCMEGVDPETKERTGPITFTVTYVPLGRDDKVVRLTPRQAELVRIQRSDGGTIPNPIAISSPSAFPRVGMWVSFFDSADPEVVETSVGAMELRAERTWIRVHPTGTGMSVQCPGGGSKATPEDTKETLPDACWFRYLRSSAQQPDQEYPVSITAHWVASYRHPATGGVWQTLNEFDKTTQMTLPVSEVQALVVPQRDAQ